MSQADGSSQASVEKVNPPSEMVDRIAKIIVDAWCNEMLMGRSVDGVATIIARQVLEGMREPTQAMILAGVHHDNMGDMAGRWQAMIDEALK